MKSYQRSVLFINPTWENHALISACAKSDFRIIGYGPTLSGLNVRVPGYSHIHGEIDDYSAIHNINNLYKPELIISDNCDYSLRISETLSHMLGKPSLGIEAANISTDKSRQRKLAALAGIRQPQFALCRSKDDVYSFVESTCRDVILKPVDSRGSIGISCVNSSSEAHDVISAIAKCLSSSPSHRFIVEEFIQGDLYTIDGFIVNSQLFLVGVGSRKRTGSGQTVTTQIIYKSSLDRVFLHKSYHFLRSVQSAFGFTNGHIHCEALLKDDEFYLVECTNRGAGVFTSSTINPYICNIDLNLELLRFKSQDSSLFSNTPAMLGKSEIIANQNDAALIFPSLGESGKILESFDLEAVRNMDLILDVSLFAQVGRPLLTSIDGPSRHFALALKTSEISTINEIVDSILSECVAIA